MNGVVDRRSGLLRQCWFFSSSSSSSSFEVDQTAQTSGEGEEGDDRREDDELLRCRARWCTRLDLHQCPGGQRRSSVIACQNDQLEPFARVRFLPEFDRAGALVDLEEIVIVGQRIRDATVGGVRLIVVRRLNRPTRFQRDQCRVIERVIERRRAIIDIKETNANRFRQSLIRRKEMTSIDG